jgi:hypothetical protein
LAVIRRAVVGVAVHWNKHCRKRRQATMSGFYDFMYGNNGKRAFALVTASKPSWLPPGRRTATILLRLAEKARRKA